MSLGQVYDLDLKRNEGLIKEVVTQAQGEMALEEFIKQVKETWTSYSLDMVNYQNKCRLIKSVSLSLRNIGRLTSAGDGTTCSTNAEST